MPLVVGAVAYTPNVVPIWEGIREYFHGSGAETDFVLFSNYGRQVDALIAGQVDIGWNTNLAWVRTVLQTDGACRALAMRDTDLAFRSVLVARAGNLRPVVILDLIERVGALAEGDTVGVPVRGPEDVTAARAWCERSGNTLIRSDGTHVLVRRGRRPDPIVELPPARRPGARLWIYTNFDCNLACDYCCARSSPRADRRALGVERIRRLAAEGAEAGVSELLLTGGEPFLLPDIGAIAESCAAVLPTTLLTNGMLFRGRRLDVLRTLPQDRLRLQISLDSPEPERHDAHRGRGTWARALEGIKIAVGEGFTVRVAATLVTSDPVEERRMRAFLTELGIAEDDQVVRPLARRGFAEEGLILTTDTLVPEITVTAEGVYWHPVAADDADQLVTTQLFPLAAAIDTVKALFRAQRDTMEARARTFPCA